MPLSVDDLAQQAGVSLELLESLSEGLPGGAGHLFTVNTFRKKRGGLREIVKPAPFLDTVAKNLHRSFSEDLGYRPPDHVHGFVRGRSTLTNASAHLAKSCVLRVDLEDFFPSIRAPQLQVALQQEGYDEKAAGLAVSIVTMAGKLPIGLSTSPFLSNLAFQDTDRVLAEYAKAEALSFTRYVDDLTFSGEVTDQHLVAIERILDDFGWSVNRHKTAFMRRGGPQYVTGLYVGTSDYPRISRKIKRRMRWILHIISSFGYEAYMTEFGGEADRMLPRRLLGWCYYIAAIEPSVGYPLLRAFDELLPDRYVNPADIDYYQALAELDGMDESDDVDEFD